MKKGRGRLIHAPQLEPGRPLNEQIATHLRGLIRSGAISGGARLPSQRLLAHDLRVSRNTVLSALAQLEREGLVSSRRGSGTFVSTSARPPRPSTPTPDANEAKPLDVTGPALDLFPMAAWAKLHAEQLSSAPKALFGEGDPAGLPALRAAIAQRVAALLPASV